MRIIIDINHPAHVHYFKYFIWKMQKKGHKFLITTSDKDISLNLLNNYGFPYLNLGNYGKGIVKKIINVPIMDIRMYHTVKKFNPDLFLSFGSIRAAHTAWLLNKIHIALEDTEHSAIWPYLKFTTYVLTPKCFQKNLGNKQIIFSGTTDFLYLHPNKFTPNLEILKDLKLTPKDTFFIVRFISWDAHHDIGVKGIENKVSFVKELEKHGRVLITSEGELPTELEHLKIKISPEKIHHVMAYATLFIGESGTMATESAALGVHAVVINPEAIQKDGSYTFGVFKFFHDYGLLDAYTNESEALAKVKELISTSNLRLNGQNKRKKLLLETDDVTEYLIDFVNEKVHVNN